MLRVAVDHFSPRLNIIMIIDVILFLSFIHISSSDQILTANIGQDVTFSCILENEFQYNQVSFN